MSDEVKTVYDFHDTIPDKGMGCPPLVQHHIMINRYKTSKYNKHSCSSELGIHDEFSQPWEGQEVRLETL